mgnify:FL=1
MYLEHFGLKLKPFNITPNPKFIFLSKNHKEVFAHLLYGLQSRCGFIEITGEVGAGKTTVLRTLFEELGDEEFKLAFIFNPSLTAEELLLEICREVGIETGEHRGGQLFPLINEFLLAENQAGRTVVLVIDEAQNLAASVLEQIRLLSNLETETDKLIQIILVGQPELADVLNQFNLRQLNQRIAIRYHLQPMDQDDSAEYIKHRLQVAGAEDRSIFEETAITYIFKHSGGLPRLINIIADRSLLTAYSENHEVVDRTDVKKSIDEQERNVRRPKASPGFLPAAITVLLVLLVGLVTYLNLSDSTVSSVAATPAPPASTEATATAEPATPRPGLPNIPVDAIRNELATSQESATFRQAVTALSKEWHVEFLPQLPAQFKSTQFLNQLKLSGWKWTPYYGDFPAIERLDTPIMLELILPGVTGRRYLAMIGQGNGSIEIAPSIHGESVLARDSIAALYSGKAYIMWRNYLDIGYYSTLGASSPDVREIQNLLNETGRDLAITGVYDKHTVLGVTHFQAENALVQDGRVGPLTLLLLYQKSAHFNPPQLSR